jgi:predicted HicB family RNase H-like nuclease
MTISDKNTRMLVIIPKELKKQLEKKAKESNRSVSNYVVTLIQKDVSK